MKRVLSALSAVVVALAVVACSNTGSSENPNDRLDAEVANFDAYLNAKGNPYIKDPTGVRMVIYKLGAGYPAKSTSSVNVDYTGRLFPDGVMFDEGTAKGPVSQYINGWKIVLSTLPEGSRARVYIPSAWGYGPSGNNSIPGNAPLEFDMSFKEIVRTSAEKQRLGADTIAIDTYLSNKGIVPQKDTTGVRYVVTQMGSGAKPGLYDKLKFTLTYKLLTDDTKTITTVDFAPTDDYDSRAVDQIADGLKKVLTSIPAGSKATAYLASPLAFGAQGAKDGEAEIPANANIIVEIDFKEIVNP
ncbi:FKBP-type peptidyl-prolyl cis-trans isomerase [Chryseolinea sp. T2]|uniref:FKBP-type peptidyl-prolyl cis-trans isomerase n=1 Tax=Chryseolinea sp. T2 TaxID=3129255 RepID=UPI0030768E73